MLQDEGNKAVLDVLKTLAKFASRYTSKVAKYGFNKGTEATKSHKMTNTKQLMRKNPNQGIYRQPDIDRGKIKEYIKQLKIHRVDFACEKNTNGKYDIIVTSANKSFIQDISYKIEQRDALTQQKKPSPEEQIAEAKKTADKYNAEHQHDKQPKLKHREIGEKGLM